MIQYSALRGAKKCFNFLLKNKAKFDPKKSCYALEGGNLNIIKNFECYDIKYAIKSLNPKIFDLCSKNYNTNEILISCCNNNFLYGINFFKNIFLKNPFQCFSKSTEISKILIEKYIIKVILSLSTKITLIMISIQLLMQDNLPSMLLMKKVKN